MAGINEFRALAEADRASAADEALPRRRAMFEASALRWEEMVRQVEDTSTRAAINGEDKVRAKLERESQGIVLGPRRRR